MRKNKEKNRKVRVVVAMSGGVDSSVAAAMLHRQGYDVVGMHLRLWSEDGQNRCCALADEHDAQFVAAKLGIPFYVFDVSRHFRRIVVDYFLKEYSCGKTPNPCVVCNKKIKFGLLWEKAKVLDADYLATGHYARVVCDDVRKNGHDCQGFCRLFRGKDKSKDQSYMLWSLTQENLRHVLFPLGELKKQQVKNLAKKWKLPVAGKSESQEICFVGGKDYRQFLRHYISDKIKPGDIVNLKNEVIGSHEGLPLYTIGQRKGLNIYENFKSRTKAKTAPLYVVGADVKKNRLIVGEEKDLFRKEMIVKNVHWILGKFSLDNSIFSVQIRYRHKAAPAHIVKISSGKVMVEFVEPQRAITSGQSAVFYKGDQVIGGGVIS